MKIGYDFYTCDEQYLYCILSFASHNHISINKLKVHNHTCTFYCSIFYRYKLLSLDYLTYTHTIGLLKYLFMFFSITKLITIICFICAIFLSSQLIIRTEIKGSHIAINQHINTLLNQYNIKEHKPLLNYQQLNTLLLKLKKDLIKEVEYLNIYQSGSIFYIEYTIKDQSNKTNYEHTPLIAKKDGLIQSIDVKSGNVMVKVNDYVKKGDLLVDHILVSTDEKLHHISVEGKIYAYTFERYNASIVHYKDESDAIMALLLKIRSQIPVDAKIDKENVLQIAKSDSKIEISVQYTLIENIAYKGESNEGSH